MWIRRQIVTVLAFCILAPGSADAGEPRKPGPLDPRGEIHVPIGVANTLDALKTFVEAEGNFSPGFATYGIYFWLYDTATNTLVAPTTEGVPRDRGFSGTGFLIPWSRWAAGATTVRTDVCQVERDSPAGAIQVVAARACVTNTGQRPVSVVLYVALRPLGAAGGPVKTLSVSAAGDALLVDGRPALVAETPPAAAFVAATDTIGEWASAAKLDYRKTAASPSGDCSGALRYDLRLVAGQTRTFGFICPVLPGRRAVAHDWDGVSQWAQLDLAEPNPPEGGVLQPDPGLDYYRRLKADAVFEQARAYWENLAGRVRIRVPDRRWAECFAAIVGHAAMEMNEGAPDVAVVNYNVFNRDGVYVANIFQKSGNFDLAAAAIDYFLAHPFNGRTHVEADNPGQVLWAMGEHWRFTRDKKWLARTYPSAAKIAGMIRYYRTTPGPHHVKATSLEFGDALPPDRTDEKPAHKRQVLKPGSCDGHHPEYTEAFDVAGLRAAAILAAAAGRQEDAAAGTRLAGSLMKTYDGNFGQRLPAGYGNYCVLWPCRLYPFTTGKAWEQFKTNGATSPGGWRYFALAKAHQGLLAGNREAGCGTIANHLDHPQMRGWYVFDEGGRSGPGGWRFARTNWTGGVAMPHGWAIAELHLLMRDCLAFEDEERLVLLAGVPGTWFTDPAGIAIENLPTHFGTLDLDWKRSETGAVLRLGGDAAPPQGFILRLPAFLDAQVRIDGKPAPSASAGGIPLPPGTKEASIRFGR